GVPSRQRANAGLDQNPVSSKIIFREGTPSRDPQVLIIALTVARVDAVERRRDGQRVNFISGHDFSIASPSENG
ncbi:hypothetical protein, partial [Rhodococcus zopfii]|uniref:hypothetical protein n=1 Tax=Rhodococcus zopfii TaxID=43772 RepID=UPI001EE05ED4